MTDLVVQDSETQVTTVQPPDTREARMYWHLYQPEVMARKDFKEYHLDLLKQLCTLKAEYDKVFCDLINEGYTYLQTSNRTGDSIRLNPLVTVRSKIAAEIHHYYKILGLQLSPEVQTTNQNDESIWA